MKKNTKIAGLALIAIIVAITIISVILYYPNSAQIKLPDGEPPQWEVKVTGYVDQERTWTLKEISQMPLTSVMVEVNGENVTYQGVSLTEFCNQIGCRWDAGPIDVTSVDGHEASLNIFQAWNSTNYPYYQISNRITLVFVEDGEWMTQDMGGPVQLVAPSFSSEFQVKNVAEVNVGLWTFSISGNVANPITVSSENLTSFQEETINGAFVPSDGERTSNWTGLSVMKLLESVNASRFSKITIVAIDGYEKNYTRLEVDESNMLVGYAENGNHLDQSRGGPYRLFMPVDKYKWAQFWVKFVKEIIVY
jgi:DMSO/TMAO reductase YedYZ molybdopterin-dependent catalytic subunit